jgi:hypothetical protein
MNSLFSTLLPRKIRFWPVLYPNKLVIGRYATPKSLRVAGVLPQKVRYFPGGTGK